MKIKSNIKNYVDITTKLFCKPIFNNNIFFCMMYILGIVTTFIHVISFNFKIPRINFFTWFFDIYLLCIILCFTKGIVRLSLKSCFSFILYSLAIIDAFCVSKFHARFGSEILNLILETNKRESSEFIEKYIGIDIIFSSVGIIIVLIIIHIIIAIKSHSSLSIKHSPKYNYYAKLFVTSLICISIFISFPSRYAILIFMNCSNIETADKYISNKTFNTPLNNLLFGIKMRQLSDIELGEVSDYQKRIIIDSCKYTSPNIVLIIGESYIKSHSQIYGYSKETTPNQIKRMKNSDNGQLIAYSDVVSPTNLTSIFFRNSFSYHSIDNSDSWSHYAFFPVVFRKAGYLVTFITNQFVKDISRDVFNSFGGFFLNDTKTDTLLFDHRNIISHQFDEGLLEDYDSLQKYNTNHNLSIFHLAGQHIDFYKRSPDRFRVFKTTDYHNRKDLNDEEKQLVADYDNATLYNDYVVEQIISLFESKDAIIIYLSDHGEECFDSLHRMGRTPGGFYSYEIAKNEYEVPFWIWYSKSYKEKHPSIVMQIAEAKDRPFMTDDLPHLLTFLAGIKFNEYKEEKNIISPKYSYKRRRLLNGIVNYDSIMAKGNN